MAVPKINLWLPVKKYFSFHLLPPRKNVIPNSGLFHVMKRCLLSSAYVCHNEWENRLQSPLLQNINIDEYFAELTRRFNTKKKPSGVDIDLFANKVTNEDQLEELEHILYRFRWTKKTITMLESTHRAVIHSFLKFGQYERLLSILNDRINYGIFPDHYCYNILMDTFLKQENNRDAAKVAVLMMLQEDFGNPISQKLALYSCHMHLREPKPEQWVLEPPKEEEVDEDDEEEVLIRVPFLKNPFFDDHFDIKDPKHLLGKTLYMVGKYNKDIVSKTYQLIGLAMYEKWEKASHLLDEFLLSSEKPVILEEGVLKFKEHIDAIPEETSTLKADLLKDLQVKIDKLKSNGFTSDKDLHSLVLERVKTIVEDEEADIKAQLQLFSKYEEDRQNALNTQIEEYLLEEREKALEVKKKELAEKEELLFFFENKDKHDMELVEVEKLWQAEEEKEKLRKVAVEDDKYVPPEVHKRYK